MIRPETQFEYLNKVATHSPGTPFMVEQFGTFCGPCKMMMPHLAQLQKKYPKFFIASISGESKEEVQQFIQENPACKSINVGLDSQQRAGRLMQANGVNGIPHAFIFDKTGKMTWHGHPSQAEPEIKKVMTDFES